jgi:hypothetical protein
VESDGKILLTIDWNTAISQVEKLEEHDVKLYPNPVLDILHLEFWDTTADKKGDFQIFTMNGNAVSHGNIVSTKENINVANLPTWNYLIKWIVGGQTFVKKFIKRSFH